MTTREINFTGSVGVTDLVNEMPRFRDRAFDDSLPQLCPIAFWWWEKIDDTQRVSGEVKLSLLI